MASLWYALFKWKISPASEDELRAADAIVTQADSRLKDNSPGPGNSMLAAVTRKLWEQYRLPILPQEEIAMADPALPIHIRIGASPDGLSTMQWNTYAVAEWQAKICKANDWKRVIVVAVPFHMGRACAVYRKVGLTPLPAAMPEERTIFRTPRQRHFGRRFWRFRANWLAACSFSTKDGCNPTP